MDTNSVLNILRSLLDKNPDTSTDQPPIPGSQQYVVPPVGFENIDYSTKRQAVPHPMVADIGAYRVPPVSLEDEGQAKILPQILPTKSNDPVSIDRSNTSTDSGVDVPKVGMEAEPPDKLTSYELNQRKRDDLVNKIISTQNMTGKEFNGGKEDKWWRNLLKGGLNGGAMAAQNIGKNGNLSSDIGDVLGGVLAGVGANAISPNLDNRIDRDREVAKQSGQLDMLNNQIGQQLKEQQVANTAANYKSLAQDRLHDNVAADNKQLQAARGQVLSSITKVFNNATVFDPDGNIRDKEIDQRFFELTGSHLPKIEKGYKGLIKSDEKTGEQTLVVYNPNNPNEAPQTTKLLNKDGSKLIAFGPTTVSNDAAGERQDKQLKWDQNKTEYERQTRIMLENLRGQIDKEVKVKDGSDALMKSVIENVMGKDVNYQMALMGGDTEKAQTILNAEVQRALETYKSFKTVPPKK